jgi:pullulanase/glycogen debranching enzyme
MHLVERGLTNYWGYNSIGFFAPESRCASSGAIGGQVTEFKQMVKDLHRAGIEVILDVVYNHSAEGNHLGPTFSFKVSRTSITTDWSPGNRVITWTTPDAETRLMRLSHGCCR